MSAERYRKPFGTYPPRSESPEGDQTACRGLTSSFLNNQLVPSEDISTSPSHWKPGDLPFTPTQLYLASLGPVGCISITLLHHFTSPPSGLVTSGLDLDSPSSCPSIASSSSSPSSLPDLSLIIFGSINVGGGGMELTSHGVCLSA
jgi:hypothetical protein